MVQALALLVIGNSDITRPEHMAEMFRLLGGVSRDNERLPTAHLAILPGTVHISPIYQVEWLASMTNAFLDAPMPETGHRRFTPDRGPSGIELRPRGLTA